jgi:hypothetical protein
MARKEKDERDLLNLPAVPQQPVIHERETIRSEGSSGRLEAIGRSMQGLDGKKYLGSVAVHVFEIDKGLTREHVFAYQSTDLRKIPETVMVQALPEMGVAIMKRYGRTPPAKTTDKNIRETERKVDA